MVATLSVLNEIDRWNAAKSDRPKSAGGCPPTLSTITSNAAEAGSPPARLRASDANLPLPPPARLASKIIQVSP